LRLRIAAGVTAEQIRSWRAAEEALVIGLDTRTDRLIEDVARQVRSATGPVVLVLGSEGQGIPPSIAGLCNERARIPMIAQAESLGVAAAGALGLYLLFRT
jgi:23S rRNA (guanosine2251-2'-O)-methyltransferase